MGRAKNGTREAPSLAPALSRAPFFHAPAAQATRSRCRQGVNNETPKELRAGYE